MRYIRKEFQLLGIIQGVGFRPTLYRLAVRLGLGGYAQNLSGSLKLVLEGREDLISSFFDLLSNELPRAARIDAIHLLQTENILAPCSVFRIVESDSEASYAISFPPDMALCADCLKEIFDPSDRRFGYAFTTCTICGPRYTVIESMPYDRERTTLKMFPLCPACEREYADGQGRRFHAESIACPDCGPKLQIADAEGRIADIDPLTAARRLLSNGQILALRGIGGFLLAVDALNEAAVKRLRARKDRPHKPLAVMARDISVVKRYCYLNSMAEDLLHSNEAPIVILDLRTEARNEIPLKDLSPDTHTLGVMLPYSPLHQLLFHPLQGDEVPAFDLLVMTSGNKRSEPICLNNQEAFERLQGIADAYLVHNREICLRADDSLLAIQGAKAQVWRRARGYAPRAIHIDEKIEKQSLGLGAELKNTIALGFDHRIVLSPHIGDLETPEAVAGLEQVLKSFPEFLRREPERVLVDLHPDMHSSVIGRQYAKKKALPVVEIQHHYAHALSCMAEYGLDKSLALVFDGLGLGVDGHIWGAECLYCTRQEFKRFGTFAGVPLPGGDAAVFDPRRQLFGRLCAAGVPVSAELQQRLKISEEEMEVWSKQIEKGINSPITHAAGRLFDAFSVLLGIAPERVTYDGQAAIRVEACAKQSQTAKKGMLHFRSREENGMCVVDWSEMFADLADGKRIGTAWSEFSLGLHESVADASIEMLHFAMDSAETRRVVLSGGVFMNRILTKLLRERLESEGIEYYVHTTIPPNDGGIAAGQVYSLY